MLDENLISEEFLPAAVRDGLAAARKSSLLKASRLRVESGGDSFRVLRLWGNGFALDADDAPNLRGLVDLFDGGRHLGQCLIVAADEELGELRYEFKRAIAASNAAPVDYERHAGDAAALLAR